MPANMENSKVATGLEKVSFHSSHKEGQCQRIFKLLHNCTHFTCQQSNAQNSPSQASTVCQPRTSRCTSWVQKDRVTRYQIGNIRGKNRNSERLYFGVSKITADGDCSHEIKRRLLLGRKAMTNLNSILKNRNITLPMKVHLVKAMVFPVVKHGCESWSIKKAEC